MAQLITASEVIDKGLMHDNIDTALIKEEFIEVSQEEHIRPILTQTLYDLIVSENNSGSLSAVNNTLLEDYIKPCLAFYVVLDLIPHMAVRTTNKGLMVNSSETSEAASREERLDIMTRYREMGDTMKEKMVRYIEDSDNLSDYPTYDDGGSEKITTNLKGGIIL